MMCDVLSVNMHLYWFEDEFFPNIPPKREVMN